MGSNKSLGCLFVHFYLDIPYSVWRYARHIIRIHIVGILGIDKASFFQHTTIVWDAIPVSISFLYAIRCQSCVAWYIVTACHAIVFWMWGIWIAACRYSHYCQSLLIATSTWSCLIEIIYHVNLTSTGTSIACTLCVIHHTVAEIDILCLCRILPVVSGVVIVLGKTLPVIACSIETRTAIGNMCYHVMMETGKLATPYTSISVCTFIVTSVSKAFCYRTPLHGEVVVVVEWSNLIDTPWERAMVYHDACLLFLCWSICSIVDIALLSSSEPDKAYDIVGTWIDGIVTECYTWRRGCLSKNGCILSNGNVRIQRYDTCNIKNNNFLWIARHSRAERAVTFIVQVGDMSYFTTSSSCYKTSMSFCSRKSRCWFELCIHSCVCSSY